MNTLETNPSSKEPKSPSEELKSKTAILIDSTLTLLLLMFTVTIVFAISSVSDVLVLYVINISFGKAIQDVQAEKILEIVQSSSAVGTIIAYVLTLVFLLYRYLKDIIAITWDIKKKKTGHLKARAKKWIFDTGEAILIVITATIIFIAFIGIIVVALQITSLLVSSSFVNVVKIIAAFAIAIGYILTLGSSLCQYGRDLLRMTREA